MMEPTAPAMKGARGLVRELEAQAGVRFGSQAWAKVVLWFAQIETDHHVARLKLEAENAELLYHLRWLTCGVDECWAAIPEHASGIAKVEQLTGTKIDKDDA